jgi:DNA-binding NarL/FixJ family response regulator
MIRVAIIEDDPSLRNRLREAINETSTMIVSAIAGSFEEGTDLIEAGGYEVLLCDLGLPGGSGIDLIRAETATGRDTDILVITVFGDQNKVVDSIRAGARGYMLKDETIADCVAAIAEIRRGGSPISPIIARKLLSQISAPDPDQSPSAPTKRPQPTLSPFSEREFEVLNLLSRGFSYVECASILSLTVNTIGTHVKNIYRKLAVNSRAEAIFEASSQGFLDRD